MQQANVDKLIDMLEPVFKITNLLQKELNGGTGPMSVVSDAGNISARSNTSALDLTQTIGTDVTELFCP